MMIKELVSDMLDDSKQSMHSKIDRILNSECIDIDNWDPKINPMIIPKCIATALLQ